MGTRAAAWVLYVAPFLVASAFVAWQWLRRRRSVA